MVEREGIILRRRNKQDLLIESERERGEGQNSRFVSVFSFQFSVGCLQKGYKGQSEVLVAMFWG